MPRPPLSEAGYNAALIALPFVCLFVWLFNSYRLGQLNRKWVVKALLVLSIVFTVLTFVGTCFVLTSKGTANAGYAVIPMVVALACLTCYRACKNKEK